MRQIVSVELRMNPVDISLIKKYKTVDVPAVHSVWEIFRNHFRSM